MQFARMILGMKRTTLNRTPTVGFILRERAFNLKNKA